MPLEPQAALETAVLNALQQQLGYTEATSGRTFDQLPPPKAGQTYVGVWSVNRRPNSSRTALDELFEVFITVSVKITLPFDRKVVHRDRLEKTVNPIRALVAKDVWGWAVTNAANLLAGYDQGSGAPIGFRGALVLEGLDPVQTVGPDHYHAAGQSREAGLIQTIRLGRCRHIQALATCV